jgi:hypothetical protein
MKYYNILFFPILLLSCNQSSPKMDMGNQIAAAHGIDNFKNVEMVEFTFHAQRDTAAASERHWQWWPKKNEVLFITDSGATRFQKGDTTTQELRKLNARFTNDEYWLFYPFHLSWDKGFELRDSSMKIAPVSGKRMRKITTKYNDKDGFTPGDMYDLYVDENNRIQEWVYHAGGLAELSMITTWEDYHEFSGMQLAQEHKSKDGKFRLWFSDIIIK